MTRVTLIRGDGIGPEIMEAAASLVEATGAPIEWEEHPAGASAIAEHSTPLPAETLASIKKNKVAFKAPLMTPVGGGYRSVNVLARQELDLYANVRPARVFEGVKTHFDKCDLVVVRENTQGLYAGIEHYLDPKKETAQAIALVTHYASDRIIRFAFEYARANGRKKVTLVHKANILKFTSGLFLRVGQEIAEEYPDIVFEDRIVDAMAMQLVMFPERFDVIVTTNLFGDILSDLTAGLVGGLGLAPSGNYGEDTAIFEAIHGTAPDIAGRGISNPTALTLSGAMMLHHLGYHEEGKRLEAAVRGVIAEGKHLTPDLKGSATTTEFTQAVRARL
ncbi:MAG: isocitrate/isopropylmalate dehydrogenase family protein [Deltaproteobacteria bacterium]|nr:isocitrate/isopropylmalate dehydrogenase family protein [Deltaproteobacteria bacterium]